MEENSGCFGCKHYVKSFGEKGYCRFYRHETMLPEEACLKFEKAEKPVRQRTFKISESDGKKHISIRKTLMINAFLAVTVLSLMLIMMALYLDITIVGFPEITAVQKGLTIFLSVVAVSLFAYLMFILGKKFLTARVLELVAATATVIFILVNYDTVWFNFTNLTVDIVELIFSSIS